MVEIARLRLLARYSRLVIGLSGGLDSIVLLHALLQEPELAPKLHAVHVHHGLSTSADAWQAHCEQVCAAYAVPLTVKHIHIKNKSNLEEAARDARFKIFEACLEPNDCLVLAHHQNDQAETLLLRLLRGAGVDGLAAMQSKRTFGCGYITRPLLNYNKQALEQYAKTHDLVWVDDESNQDLKFSRNYIRHEIMPRVQKIWPRVVEAISACAEHCQEAQANLDDLAHIDCPDLALKQDKLLLTGLTALPLRRLKQVLRIWFKNQGVKALSSVKLEILIQEVIFSQPDAMPLMHIGKLTVRRYRDSLYLVREIKKPDIATLTLPSLRIPTGAVLDIRFRAGGESLVLHGQTKSLKSLFQAWGVPPWERDSIPLIFINNKLAAVLDFAVGDDYHESSNHGQSNLESSVEGVCVDDIV